MEKRYHFETIEKQMQEFWEKEQIASHSQRTAAYRPCFFLHPGGNDRPLPPYAGLQRVLPLWL